MASSSEILTVDENGIYCPKGDFYIDPWKPVKTALITHGHADHLKSGHKEYYVPMKSKALMEHRLRDAPKYSITLYNFDETFEINGVSLSFHPAGHILGSAQVRVEVGNEVWVASGDYKRVTDPSCQPFELVKGDGFISEATFGLPIYRWNSSEKVIDEIIDWWSRNANEGKPSVLFCYVLGKAQRILAGLAKKITELPKSVLYTHGSMDRMNQIYRDEGVNLLDTENATQQEGNKFSEDLILAPPSALRTQWMKRFKRCETAFASGWMRVRGPRRMSGYDKGFVISDHADWPSLITTIKETQANEIRLLGSNSQFLARFLREQHNMDVSTINYNYEEEEG